MALRCMRWHCPATCRTAAGPPTPERAPIVWPSWGSLSMGIPDIFVGLHGLMPKNYWKQKQQTLSEPSGQAAVLNGLYRFFFDTL